MRTGSDRCAFTGEFLCEFLENWGFAEGEGTEMFVVLYRRSDCAKSSHEM